MTKLIELQNQIDKLQKEAKAIKSKEFDSTVRDILAKMNAFGITLKDLKPGNVKSIPAKKAGGKKKTGVTLPAKYRGLNGETWTGINGMYFVAGLDDDEIHQFRKAVVVILPEFVNQLEQQLAQLTISNCVNLGFATNYKHR